MKLLDYAWLAAIVGTFAVAWIALKPQPHELPRKKRMKKIERERHKRDRANAALADLYGGGTACPNCLRWPWESEQDWTDTTMSAVLTCGTCGHQSHWIDGPGIMLPIKPPMAPIVIG